MHQSTNLQLRSSLRSLQKNPREGVRFLSPFPPPATPATAATAEATKTH